MIGYQYSYNASDFPLSFFLDEKQPEHPADGSCPPDLEAEVLALTASSLADSAALFVLSPEVILCLEAASPPTASAT